MPTAPATGIVQVNAETGNTRVVRPRPPVAVDAGAAPALLAMDELGSQIRAGAAFAGFLEAPIGFPPTYKYDAGTPVYDTSPKRRVPAWTDRVLFSPDGIAPYEYDHAPEASRSDHRPVFAKFTVLLE